MEKDYIRIKDIVTRYQKQVEMLSAQKEKIKLLYENETIINPIYSSFIELNKIISICEEYWKSYCFERDSIIMIEENAILACPSKKQLKKMKETIPRTISYHSKRETEFYCKYLEYNKIKSERTKETNEYIVSLFNSIYDIYPNFNKNVTFTACTKSPISFEEKATNLTNSFFEIDYEKIIENIFTLAINQIDSEISEKKADVVNVIIEFIEGEKENDKPAILIKE